MNKKPKKTPTKKNKVEIKDLKAKSVEKVKGGAYEFYRNVTHK